MKTQYIQFNIKSFFLILLLFTVFNTQKINAQDVHFSQFYVAPLLLNPAMNGHIEGKFRLNLNYKRQWTGVTKSGVYNSPAISFDINLRKRSNSRHSFGLGLSLLNDLSSADNKLSNLTVLLGGAAHLNIDNNEKHFFSIGIQSGFMNRRFKTQNMLFASQYDGEDLNSSMASGENFDNSSMMNIDSRIGIIYSAYPSAKTDVKIGFAVFHPIKFNESILDLEYMRAINYVAHGEFNHYINGKVGIQPYFQVMSQAKALEITAGSNVSFMFADEKSFFIGGGYRFSDGAIATIGTEINHFRLGFSYDVATSDLGMITNGRGDFEISLQYIGVSKKSEEPVLPALRYF